MKITAALFKRSLIILFFGIAVQSGFAQCDLIADECVQYVPATEYISDGQLYRALLLNDEVAEFRTTFYGGSTYRIAACSGGGEGNLIFRIFDEKRNLLFSSNEFNKTSYWDFKFTSTMNCIIEGQLNTEKVASGCAVFLIGFK